MQHIEVKAALQIRKPVSEVFEAIVNPQIMKNYFISKSTGRMEEDKTVISQFPAFEFDIPVLIGKIEKDKFDFFFLGWR